MKHLSILFLLATRLVASTTVTLEQGSLWQSKNVFSIPGNTGTRLDLADHKSGPFYSGRVEVKHSFNKNHGLRVLLAPFSAEIPFRITSNLSFRGNVFSANQILIANYMFNSYRVSYLYTFDSSSQWKFTLGLTAKLRHANIKVSDGVTSLEDPGVGFVPLIHFEILRIFDSGWELSLGGDALAAPQGRAADLLLKASLNMDERWKAYVGYRTLEGGADNDNVYTFSWFHSAVLGISHSF